MSRLVVTKSSHSKAMTKRRIIFGRLVIWIAAGAVIGAGMMRYLEAPSFWLDEAWIAVSLRNPSLEVIFAPLEKGMYFPRIYLACIAALRTILGYQIWVLRLLPFLSFVVGTTFWALLLAKRSGSLLLPGLLGGALLIGSSFWLEQAIQLKQYSFDVMFALIPFLISDAFFKDALIDGRRKMSLTALTLPVFLSYTFPIALGARVLGWYLYYGRRGWRLHLPGVCALIAPIAVGLVSIWFTDYRHNVKHHLAYLKYWHACILRSRIQEGIGSGLRLIADYVWGWHHGRLLPLVVAAIAPLQALGLYHAFNRWKTYKVESGNDSWGSRTVGSLILLSGVVLASILVSYPICAGRLTLFTQVHTQILAIEGILFVLGVWNKRKGALILLAISIGIVTVYSAHRYIRLVQEEPTENLRPMLSLIKPEVANTLWVHPCSIAQVRSLPEPLPVNQVLLNTRRQLPPTGEKTWILWTHMSDGDCRERLDEVRSQARSWQLIHEGPGRGLALAEF
ncbi:MAG TPA: hypothetical protein VNO70_11850 [Blastocatellia bacterium]|nr:hypothetical protein [Blastocatellia bacterium]